MRSIQITEFGDAEVLELADRVDPGAPEDEVVVEVKACALNHLDLQVRRGEMPYLTLPLVPGSDVAGVLEGSGERVVIYPVLSCGNCPTCVAGREHLCPDHKLLGVHRDGGLAERVSVPRRNAIPVPDTWDLTEWASVPMVFLGALHALVGRANLRVGDTILVHSAGSGLGTAAIQIASAGGARVIATSPSDEKLAKARELGADEVVNTGERDFAEAVRDFTKGRGVDVVLDHIGGSTLVESVSCLARGGRLLAVGETASPSATVALRPLFHRERSILGSYLGSRREFLDVLSLLAEKTVRPVVDATFPLERTAEAHTYLEERHAFGKVVIEL